MIVEQKASPSRYNDNVHPRPPTISTMASPFPQLNPARFRTYLFRLPFFTRVVVIIIVIFCILELQSAWNVAEWGALVPKEVNLFSSEYHLLLDQERQGRIATANAWRISVQDEHLPYHPSWILSCHPKPSCYRPLVGEIRGRSWNDPVGRDVPWTYVARMAVLRRSSFAEY